MLKWQSEEKQKPCWVTDRQTKTELETYGKAPRVARLAKRGEGGY